MGVIVLYDQAEPGKDANNFIVPLSSFPGSLIVHTVITSPIAGEYDQNYGYVIS